VINFVADILANFNPILKREILANCTDSEILESYGSLHFYKKVEKE